MNFKKFISGVSALAIAASAFAGLAVTASATVESDVFGHQKITWDFSALGSEQDHTMETSGNDYVIYVNANDYSVTTSGEASSTVAKVTLKANNNNRYIKNGEGVRFGTDGSIVFEAPTDGTVTFTGTSTSNRRLNGDDISTVSAGTVTVTAKSGMTVKQMIFTPSDYGQAPAGYDGPTWSYSGEDTYTIAAVDTEASYLIKSDMTGVTSYGTSKTGTGYLVFFGKGATTYGKISSDEGTGFKFRNGDEVNYVAPANGVVTIVFGASTGNYYVKPSVSSKTNLTDGSIPSNQTYKVYVSEGNRIQIISKSSKTVQIKSFSFDSTGTAASLATKGAVTKVNEDVITADDGAEGAAYANAYTFTVQAGNNAPINASQVKVNNTAYESETVISGGSTVLFGIIATASDAASLPEASAFTVTVE